MPRTTPEAVKDILQTDYDSFRNPSLTGRIEAAAVVVDRVVACAASRGETISTTEQEVLERWLAAHMYCMSDPQYTSRSTGGGSGSFKGQGGLGLDQTSYGQTCKLLDGTGCLTALEKRQSATMVWLGLNPSEQTDYDDRR